jgi:hypothetical protein
MLLAIMYHLGSILFCNISARKHCILTNCICGICIVVNVTNHELYQGILCPVPPDVMNDISRVAVNRTNVRTYCHCYLIASPCMYF